MPPCADPGAVGVIATCVLVAAARVAAGAQVAITHTRGRHRGRSWGAVVGQGRRCWHHERASCETGPPGRRPGPRGCTGRTSRSVPAGVGGAITPLADPHAQPPAADRARPAVGPGARGAELVVGRLALLRLALLRRRRALSRG